MQVKASGSLTETNQSRPGSSSPASHKWVLANQAEGVTATSHCWWQYTCTATTCTRPSVGRGMIAYCVWNLQFCDGEWGCMVTSYVRMLCNVGPNCDLLLVFKIWKHIFLIHLLKSSVYLCNLSVSYNPVWPWTHLVAEKNLELLTLGPHSQPDLSYFSQKYYNIFSQPVLRNLCWAIEMAQHLKALATQAWQPDFDPQKPCKSGRKKINSLRTSSDLHTCAVASLHTHITCAHLIIIIFLSTPRSRRCLFPLEELPFSLKSTTYLKLAFICAMTFSLHVDYPLQLIPLQGASLSPSL